MLDEGLCFKCSTNDLSGLEQQRPRPAYEEAEAEGFTQSVSTGR